MVKVSGCLGCLIAFLYVLFELFQSKQESNSASDFLQSYSLDVGVIFGPAQNHLHSLCHNSLSSSLFLIFCCKSLFKLYTLTFKLLTEDRNSSSYICPKLAYILVPS